MKLLIGSGPEEFDVEACRGLVRYALNKYSPRTLTIALPDSLEGGEQFREWVQTDLNGQEVEINFRRLGDQPGPELVELAETDSHELILLRGGFRTPMGKYRLGSTVEFVVLNSSVSVNLVR